MDSDLRLRRAVDRVQALKNEVGIVLVVNVKGRSPPADDYTATSIVTEFLSEDELDEIVGGLKDAGFYVETILDEERFLEWTLRRGWETFPRQQVLVYNLAQNGTGPARLALVASLANLKRLNLADSDAYAVAIAQQKYHCGLVLRDAGLPAARAWLWRKDVGWVSAPPPAMRVILKPVHECASVGVDGNSIVDSGKGLDDSAQARAEALRQDIVAQEFISGYEVEVPVFDLDGPVAPRAVGIAVRGRKRMGDDILRYADVFSDAYEFFDFAEVLPSAAVDLQRLAERAFRAVGMQGIGRVDFRVTDDGQPWIIEVACKPHLTRHGSCAAAAKWAGLTHSEMLSLLAARRATGGRQSELQNWMSVSRKPLP